MMRIKSFAFNAVLPCLLLPLAAMAGQENPPPNKVVTLSGITVFSGWKCDPGTITFTVDSGAAIDMASGTNRPDTTTVCSNSGDNGYGVLYNVNRFGNGQHVARFYDNGVQFAEATFNVVTLGHEFATGLSGSAHIDGFPATGEGVGIEWVESLQGFQISSYCTGSACPPAALDPRNWGACTWETVGTVPSHNDQGDWCPDGTFITQVDLDSDGGVADTDSPIIGRARCCQMEGGSTLTWSACSWNTVGLTESHQQGLLQWCQDGRFITQLDLDSSSSGADSPYVGRARCCNNTGLESRTWAECQWVQVGLVASHNDQGAWCPSGSFLTQYDLDNSGSAADSPVIGHARCCRLSQ